MLKDLRPTPSLSDVRADDEPAVARSKGPLSISVLLALLILAAVLPPLVFSIVLFDRNNRAQDEVVATLAEAAAGAAVETIDRQLQGMITTLRGLATSNALQEGRAKEFYDGARVALADTGSYLVVLDKDMNQVLNTRRAFGEPLGKSQRPDAANLALETGNPVISDGFFGQVTKQWVFNILLPWSKRDADPLVFVLTQSTGLLSGALAMEDLRGGWNAVVVDTNQIVLTSTLMSSDVGKPFFLAQAETQPGAIRRSARFEGNDYDFVVKKSVFSGWSVILWAERDVVQRPMYRTMRLLVLGGLAMLAAGGLAAWFFGRQISKSVRQLAADARRLGAGEAVVAQSYPVRELDVVSAALSDAAKQRQAAENEIRFLMREVAHRSKNQLTVVSSIAKQSARSATSISEFGESFQQRLMGLARSTDLLISGSVAGVELGELMRVQVEPFGPEEKSRLRIEGPQSRLSLQAAQTLGLAIHEMATNAAKYGAFATPAGRLVVKWNLVGNDLVVTWREYTPHAPTPSDHKGFGTQLIERMLTRGLGAAVEREHHPDGLEIRCTIPVSSLRKETPEPGVAEAGSEA